MSNEFWAASGWWCGTWRNEIKIRQMNCRQIAFISFDNSTIQIKYFRRQTDHSSVTSPIVINAWVRSSRQSFEIIKWKHLPVISLLVSSTFLLHKLLRSMTLTGLFLERHKIISFNRQNNTEQMNWQEDGSFICQLTHAHTHTIIRIDESFLFSSDFVFDIMSWADEAIKSLHELTRKSVAAGQVHRVGTRCDRFANRRHLHIFRFWIGTRNLFSHGHQENARTTEIWWSDSA